MPVTLRLGSAAEAGMAEPNLRAVSARAKEWMASGSIQTMVLIAARRGVVAFHESFGHLGAETSSPPAPLNAIFRIASITKVITATGLMQLVEDGKVSLIRPVANYLPEFQGSGKEKVLVRHLLTHTSGINAEQLEKYAEETEGKVPIPAAESTLHPVENESLALRFAGPLAKPPGTEMSYSDFNFDLVGEIIRRVSGQSLDRFAAERILRPLGMNDTHYCRLDADQSRRVTTPRIPGEPPSPLEKIVDTERLCCGSGLAVSTAMDMAIFAQMFLNRGEYGGVRILSPTSVKEMTRNQIPGIKSEYQGEVFPEASWGLGWSIHGRKTSGCGSLYSAESFEHWGAGGTYLWADPRRDLVGVYFSAFPWDTAHQEFIDRTMRDDLFTDMVTAAVLED